MPETAVHEDRDLPARESEVRLAGLSSVMQPVPQTYSVQVAAHLHFGFGIASKDGAHHPGARSWRDRIDHYLFLSSSRPVLDVQPGSIPWTSATLADRALERQ